MTYEETVELEENIKLKNKANKLYKLFLEKVKLDPSKYDFKNNRFLIWSDSHNKEYIAIEGNNFVFQCRYLHEAYSVVCSPPGIFKALKMKYRGVEHLESKLKYWKDE